MKECWVEELARPETERATANVCNFALRSASFLWAAIVELDVDLQPQGQGVRYCLGFALTPTPGLPTMRNFWSSVRV